MYWWVVYGGEPTTDKAFKGKHFAAQMLMSRRVNFISEKAIRKRELARHRREYARERSRRMGIFFGYFGRIIEIASTVTDITGAGALVKYGAKYAFKQGAKFFRKRTLYRGDSRLPQEIIRQGGFNPRGGFDDLIKNVEKAYPESAFVSASKKTKRKVLQSFYISSKMTACGLECYP